MWEKLVISKKFDFVNKSLFPVVELKLSGRQFEVGNRANLFASKLSGRQFEVGDKANTGRIKTVSPQTLHDVS